VNDDEILEIIRRESHIRPPREVAGLLEGLAAGGLTQSSLVSYFTRAFPAMPLGVVLNASGWRRVSRGGRSDDDFDALLQPWFPRVHGM